MSSVIATYLFVILLIAAAAGDMLSYRIPNRLIMVIALLFPLCAFVMGMAIAEIGWHVAAGAAVLVISFVLFALRLFGGGDAKLLAAVALWLGWPALLPFLVWTVMAGGLLGLLIGLKALVDRYIRHVPVNTQVPYGVAIAAGAIIALPFSVWVTAT